MTERNETTNSNKDTDSDTNIGVPPVVMNPVEVSWGDEPFALFAGSTYYPAPGMRDIVGLHSALDEAIKQGKVKAKEYYGWFQVVDLRTLTIVAGEGSGHTGLFGLCAAGDT